MARPRTRREPGGSWRCHGKPRAAPRAPESRLGLGSRQSSASARPCLQLAASPCTQPTPMPHRASRRQQHHPRPLSTSPNSDALCINSAAPTATHSDRVKAHWLRPFTTSSAAGPEALPVSIIPLSSPDRTSSGIAGHWMNGSRSRPSPRPTSASVTLACATPSSALRSSPASLPPTTPPAAIDSASRKADEMTSPAPCRMIPPKPRLTVPNRNASLP